MPVYCFDTNLDIPANFENIKVHHGLP